MLMMPMTRIVMLVVAKMVKLMSRMMQMKNERGIEFGFSTAKYFCEEVGLDVFELKVVFFHESCVCFFGLILYHLLICVFVFFWVTLTCAIPAMIAAPLLEGRPDVQPC